MKRLQILIDDNEFRTVERLARGEDITTAEWVRRRLREAQHVSERHAASAKLAAIELAYQHRGPTGDIEKVLAEMERA